MLEVEEASVRARFAGCWSVGGGWFPPWFLLLEAVACWENLFIDKCVKALCLKINVLPGF